MNPRTKIQIATTVYLIAHALLCGLLIGFGIVFVKLGSWYVIPGGFLLLLGIPLLVALLLDEWNLS